MLSSSLLLQPAAPHAAALWLLSPRDIPASGAGSSLDKIVNWGSLVGNSRPVSCLATLCKEVSLLQTFLPRWRLFQVPVLWWILLATGVQSITGSDAEEEACTPQRCLFRGRLSYVRHACQTVNMVMEREGPPPSALAWKNTGANGTLGCAWLQPAGGALAPEQVYTFIRVSPASRGYSLSLHPGKEDKCFPSAIG